MTYEDIVKILGVAKITLYGWVCRAKIPFLKINGLVRFRQSDIDAWIESCKREAGERREKKPTRRGRPRKVDTAIQDSSINRIIAAAKREAVKEQNG